MRKIFFIVILLLVGCAGISTMSSTHRDQYTKRIYQAPQNVVFSATVKTLKASGYPILFVDEKSGIIDAGSKSINVFAMQQKVNASIEEIGPASASVQLFLSIDGREDQDFSDYKKILDEIGKNIK